MAPNHPAAALLRQAKRLLFPAVVAFVLAAAPSASAASGEPDPTFGSGGIFTHEFSPGGPDSGSHFQGVELAPGGKIDLIGGVDNSDGRQTLAARRTEAGTLDPSFGAGGAVVTTLRPREGGQLLFQFSEAEHVGEDGSLVFAGPGVFGRFTPSGQLDSSYEHSETRMDIYALAALGNGDLMAGGHENSEINGPSPAELERLLPNGARDSSFGNEGVVNLPITAGENTRE